MSRPTLLRCAVVLAAALATSFLIAGVGAVSVADTTDAAPLASLISFPLVAWPLVRALLPP